MTLEVVEVYDFTAVYIPGSGGLCGISSFSSLKHDTGLNKVDIGSLFFLDDDNDGGDFLFLY
jgi:hypothetical protein